MTVHRTFGVSVSRTMFFSVKNLSKKCYEVKLKNWTVQKCERVRDEACAKGGNMHVARIVKRRRTGGCLLDQCAYECARIYMYARRAVRFVTRIEETNRGG